MERWKNPLQRAFQAMSGSRLSSADKDSAVLAGSSVLAHGIVERVPSTNQIQLTVELYDVGTHKLLKSASASDSEPLAAVTKLAKVLEPKAQGFGNVSEQGVQLWVGALNSREPAAWADNCRKLLEAEPAFGPGYVACGNAPLSPEDREVAGDRGFTHRARLRPEEQLAVGQFLFQSSRFQQAAEVMTAVAPSIPAAWNTVGYSQAAMGNLAAAQKALGEYRKFGGDEPNAVDSLGEVHYMAGKYAEAEKYFLESAEKFPQSRQGSVAKLKAAAMRALQGNRGGAEELAQSMIAALKKNNQNTKPLEELWRNIILEQDPRAMRERVESSGIIVPTGRPR